MFQKKKVIISIITLSILLLVGCNNNTAFKEAINLGNEALENGKYEVALEEFGKALEEKKDDEVATNLYNQSKKYIEAKKLYKSNNFDDCIKLLDEVLAYENGSEILLQEAKKLKLQTEKVKELNYEINNLVKSSKDYFSNKKYERAIEDINKALKLMGSNEDYDTQREILKELKSNCESSIAENNKGTVSKNQESSPNKGNISEGQAISILSQYFINEIGYAPNTIEVYEIVGNRYHLTADNYDENGTRGTFGWWYVDMSTGAVSR